MSETTVSVIQRARRFLEKGDYEAVKDTLYQAEMVAEQAEQRAAALQKENERLSRCAEADRTTIEALHRDVKFFRERHLAASGGAAPRDEIVKCPTCFGYSNTVGGQIRHDHDCASGGAAPAERAEPDALILPPIPMTYGFGTIVSSGPRPDLVIEDDQQPAERAGGE